MIKINPIAEVQKYKFKIEPLGNLRYRISWDQPNGINVTGYKIFAGFEPFYIRSLISGMDPLPATQTSFEFQFPNTVHTDMDIYFWVAYISNGNMFFINEFGKNERDSVEYNTMYPSQHSYQTTMYIADDMKYFFEEIRRRAKAVWEDICEEVVIYKSQWNGLPDSYTQQELNDNPTYNEVTRSDGSYGTGFYPGYFPGYVSKVRFGSLPQFTYEFQPQGMVPVMAIDSAWTLWEPNLRQNDLIYRKLDGKFYMITSVGVSNIRGIRIVQRLTIEPINPTSPLNKINNDDLVTKWNNINKLDYLRIGFGVMPGDGQNIEDYLLFRF